MGLLPGRFNFKLWRGGSFSKVVYLRDKNGIPIPLSGYTAVFNLPDRTLTPGSGLTLGDDGSVQIFISGEDTRAITWKRANYELIISSGGQDYPMLTGQIIALGV